MEHKNSRLVKVYTEDSNQETVLPAETLNALNEPLHYPKKTSYGFIVNNLLSLQLFLLAPNVVAAGRYYPL